MSNFYELLGVTQNANDAEIKAAYRRLAVELHPDKNPDPVAQERFKTINAAYDALKDPQKRAQYDDELRFGNRRQQNPHPGGFHQHPSGFTFHFGGGDPFGFNGFTGPNMGGASFEDIIRGMHGIHPGQQHRAHNQDLVLRYQMTLEEAFTGKEADITFQVPGGGAKTFHATIPSGISTGMRIRYKGQGHHTVKEAPPGDLYVEILVLDHPTFNRNGQDLHMELVISAYDAILGVDRNIQTIDGTIIKLTIPPATQFGTQMRVPGKGMTIRDIQARGDLYVHIGIQIPIVTTDEHKSLIEQLKAA